MNPKHHAGSPHLQVCEHPHGLPLAEFRSGLFPCAPVPNHPSPEAASEPPDCRPGEGGAEHQEENPNDTAQRRELLVRVRIEHPETIKSRASPQQGSWGETGHGRTKEQENVHRSASGRLRPGSESRLVRFVACIC
jgi:hypothetical protein